MRNARMRSGRVLAAVALGFSVIALAPAPWAHAAGGTLSATPTAGLDASSATVRVTGAGFKTTGNGIYVAVADSAKYSTSNADAFGAAKWIHVGATPSSGQDVLNSDGTFTTTLTVAAVFGDGTNATDCRVDACAIYTLAAHGSSDRSQDAKIGISFAPAATATPVVTPTAQPVASVPARGGANATPTTGNRSSSAPTPASRTVPPSRVATTAAAVPSVAVTSAAVASAASTANSGIDAASLASESATASGPAPNSDDAPTAPQRSEQRLQAVADRSSRGHGVLLWSAAALILIAVASTGGWFWYRQHATELPEKTMRIGEKS